MDYTVPGVLQYRILEWVDAGNLGDVGLLLVLEGSLECEMATHSSILA